MQRVARVCQRQLSYLYYLGHIKNVDDDDDDDDERNFMKIHQQLLEKSR